MKKLLLILLCLPVIGFGQTFNDYEYIKLESNDYSIDIMSIATNIFNQKGFIVLDNNSTVPNGVSQYPCNILTAKIDYKRGKTGWSNSRLKLSLLNCKNKVIYYKKSTNTTNFNEPDVLNNFTNATNSIPTKKVVTNQNKKTKHSLGEIYGDF